MECWRVDGEKMIESRLFRDVEELGLPHCRGPRSMHVFIYNGSRNAVLFASRPITLCLAAIYTRSVLPLCSDGMGAFMDWSAL
jgi:hypothetical protein